MDLEIMFQFGIDPMGGFWEAFVVKTNGDMHKPKGLYIIDSQFFEAVYGPQERETIARMVDILGPAQTEESIRRSPNLLGPCEVIFTGWGCPKLDREFLSAAPDLRLVLYAAGTTREIISEEMWNRNILLSSSYVANALPVVEYAMAMIFFSLKHGWHYALKTKRDGFFPEKQSVPGGYGSTVGLVSMGMVARILCEKLRSFDLDMVVFDPFLSAEEANELNVRRVGLRELFEISDVVSIHAPALPETNGLITGELIAAMRPGAALINTARGSVIREDELIDVVRRRPDLRVVLDVTDPEPPVCGSALYELPNIVLTPHIAGSLDTECRRLSQAMIEELHRYLKGEPLCWAITPELARISSHRPAFMNGEATLLKKKRRLSPSVADGVSSGL